MNLKMINDSLKSKFGFWLVTTVLVGTATTLNAFLQTYFTERQRSSTQVHKLDLEIQYRISQYMVALSKITNQKSEPWALKQPYNGDHVKLLTQSLVGQPKPVADLLYFSMYPKDFADRPLASLMAELESELKTPGAFREQITYVSGGKLFEGDKFDGREFENVAAIASSVNQYVLHERWRSSFYYLDCPATSPLC